MGRRRPPAPSHPAGGASRAYDYNAYGKVTAERGELYRLDYHPNGLISRETGFDGRSCAYAYDLNGHLLERLNTVRTVASSAPLISTASA